MSTQRFESVDNMEESVSRVQICFALMLCVLALLFAKVWYRGRRLKEYCDKLPGAKTNSIAYYVMILRYIYFVPRSIGATTVFLQMACGFCHLFSRETIAHMWVAFRPFVVFVKPESVEVLLSSHTTIDKSQLYHLLHPWLATGLLTSTGNKWRSRRKLLTHAFHFRILEDFMPIFNEQSMVLANKLLKKSHEPHVDIIPLMTMCTLDIICETAMGVKMQAQSGVCEDYVRAVNEIAGWKFLRSLRLVHGFTRKVIKEKKERLINQNNNSSSEDSVSGSSTKRKVFLELLLEHHLKDESSFTEEDIREEVDTFMFEGHDTTATALSFTLYNIGLLPQVQENLIREMDSIFGEDTRRPVTAEDLRLMKYTECVIKESLRLYPPVPVFARELREDIKVLDHTVVPGSLCTVFPLMLHRNPEVFPNPEKFDPERFFPENVVGRHPYAYVPFSAGPRNCIGQKFAIMEEKTVLANIFRRMRVRSLDQRDQILLTPDIILKSAKPLRINITPR